MDDCIFCKLANGSIPTDMVYQNEDIACFRDANPQAETHVLIVPKAHFKDVLDLASSEEGKKAMTAVLEAVPEIVRILGLEPKGFRLINNCGKGAGQSVFHVHFHLLSDQGLKERLV